MARIPKSKDTAVAPQPKLEPVAKSQADFSPEAVQRRTLDTVKRVVAAGWGTQSVVEILAAIETSVIKGSPPSWVTDQAAAAAIEANAPPSTTNSGE